MSTSTPGSRRDEDLPGISEVTDRRQGRSAGSRKPGGRQPGGRKPGTSAGGQRRARMRGPARTLLALLALLLALFGGIGAAHAWASQPAPLTPQLGLDLAGGRQIVIEPATEGASVSNEQLEQAIDIIRNRVDGGGVNEAEISRMGTNIQVSIPGNPTAEQLEALSRSSQMSFRPVLVAQPVAPPGEEPAEQRTLPLPPTMLQEQLDQATPPPPLQPGEDEAPVDDAPAEEVPAGDEAPAEENRGGERIPASSIVEPTIAPGVPAPEDAEATTEPGEEQAPPVANPSDLAQITPELEQRFVELDCSSPTAQAEVAAQPADEPIVSCNAEGTEKFILGPVELSGAHLTDATAGLEQRQAGVVTGRWEVVLNFDDEGAEIFADVTSRLMSYPSGSAQNRFAMVLDGEVISAPTVNNVISGGVAQITGDFTAEEAQTLANQLRFGALPLSFEVQTSEQISPTLGGEQLRWGIIAGAVGLLLVFVFMLIQYHALGLVAVASLIVAALLAYGAVTLLGWANDFRLTMAGVTGLIVSIGITADSFIVYFERIRDEVRAGRPLRYAVDTGWERARRTLIISDVVNLIAAGVLYFLSEAGVAAFAFMLGLMTVIDLIVVFMFTHPLVSILANTRYFGEGRKWSGMEPERLGAKRSTYLGRGQVRTPDVVAPGRRRHTREELEGGVV